MDFPDIEGLIFESCCEQSIEDIKGRLKLKKILDYALPSSVVATIILTPYQGYKNILSTAWSIKNTDFVTFAYAMKEMNHLGFHEIREVCFYEAIFRHPNGKLHQFWRSMYNIFEQL